MFSGVSRSLKKKNNAPEIPQTTRQKHTQKTDYPSIAKKIQKSKNIPRKSNRCSGTRQHGKYPATSKSLKNDDKSDFHHDFALPEEKNVGGTLGREWSPGSVPAKSRESPGWRTRPFDQNGGFPKRKMRKIRRNFSNIQRTSKAKHKEKQKKEK